jgi:hypothetical protein
VVAATAFVVAATAFVVAAAFVGETRRLLTIEPKVDITPIKPFIEGSRAIIFSKNNSPIRNVRI